MRSDRLPWSWGTPADDDVDLGLHKDFPGRVVSLHRSVEINARAQVVYRWICQLKVAPYSYDLVDNFGRRSPRQLTPGVEELAQGQRWMVFRISDFESGVHITGRALPGAERLFGPMVCRYQVEELSPATSRLVARLDLVTTSRLRKLAAVPLAWGDLIMMRKQLLTLKSLAERDQNQPETL